MKHYVLDEDEVPLYKGKVERKEKSGETELVLTNKRFIFVTITQNEFMSEIVSVNEYSVSEVKEYKGIHQVLRKGNVVEIYFLHDEVEFAFEKGSECKKFISAALETLTSKNKFRRAVDKVSKVNAEREYLDETLHIDSVGIVKNAAKGIGKTFGAIKNIGFGKKKDK